MNLHEHQAKTEFRAVGIPVPESALLERVPSLDEAERLLDALAGGAGVVLKAQVHSGGRGKAGGVCAVDAAEALVDAARRLLGTRLVTGQSGPEGLPVDALLVETATVLEREVYVAFLIDRTRAFDTLVISPDGGMDIEQVAAEHPERILRLPVSPVTGLQPFHLRRAVAFLGLAAASRREAAAALSSLLQAAWSLYRDADAALLEINPLAQLAGGEWCAVDAKLVLDDSAEYRQRERFALRDARQSDASEARAREHALNYIRLDGRIGCMVNGAGLAMATMDLIAHHGGRPANFLDVGGGTTVERVTAAFELILSDASVRAVLVNIFGGIVRCDLIAEGIIEALRRVDVAVPVVVRLEGTNAERGLALLADSEQAVRAIAGLDDAARTVVELAATGATA